MNSVIRNWQEPLTVILLSHSITLRLNVTLMRLKKLQSDSHRPQTIYYARLYGTSCKQYVIWEESRNNRSYCISHFSAEIVLYEDFSQTVAKGIALQSVANNSAYRGARSQCAWLEAFLDPRLLCRHKLRHKGCNEIESHQLHKIHVGRYSYNAALRGIA